MTATGSLDSPPTRFDAVVIRLSRIALDLHLTRLPAGAPNRSGLDNAITAIDGTIRECQILAVRNLLTGAGTGSLNDPKGPVHERGAEIAVQHHMNCRERSHARNSRPSRDSLPIPPPKNPLSRTRTTGKRVLHVGTAIVVAALMVLLAPAATAKPARPANDDIKRATKITSLSFTDNIETSRATSSRSDPKDCGSTSNSVWYILRASTDMTVAMGTLGSSYSTDVAVYTGTRGHLTPVTCGTEGVWFQVSEGLSYYVMVASAFGGGGSLVFNVVSHIPPPNDDFDNATAIPDLPFSETIDTVAATSAADDPTNCTAITRSSVWYTFTPATDNTVVISTQASEYAADIHVYTGQRGALTPIACGFRGLNFSVTGGVTYYFMVTINNGQGDLVFDVVGHHPPANDDIDDATVIPTLPFTDSVDTRGATTAPGEPPFCNNTNSVWYAITPTVSQLLVLDTNGSSYGTQIGVFTGAPDTLELVTCGGNLGVSFSATAGVTYYIQIVGAGGDLVFNTFGHLPAPNDDFDNATTIAHLPYTDDLDTTATAVAPDDPTDCAGANGRTVWYAITPFADVSLTVDTSQSNYRAVFCVYTGSRGTLTKAADGFQQVTFQATAGITYYFMVADVFGDFEGDRNLVLQLR